MGSRLAATGRCIYAMRVTEAMSFDEYWVDVSFRDKRPVRNGSRKMMVGDNIYHRDSETCTWLQADSHHSNPDGTPNPHNVANDTQADRVLISEHFLYFGRAAPVVPTSLLDELGYRNVRNYRVFAMGEANDVIEWLHTDHRASVNFLLADPYDFEGSAQRYSARDNRIR